jgi:hypothetical protein
VAEAWCGQRSGSLWMVFSDPGFMLGNNGFVYFEKGNLEPRVFWPGVFGGSVPGGSVAGGTSVELGGAVMGGVLASWL